MISQNQEGPDTVELAPVGSEVRKSAGRKRSIEKVLVNFLDMKGVLNSATDVMADDELG